MEPLELEDKCRVQLELELEDGRLFVTASGEDEDLDGKLTRHPVIVGEFTLEQLGQLSEWANRAMLASKRSAE